MADRETDLLFERYLTACASAPNPRGRFPTAREEFDHLLASGVLGVHPAPYRVIPHIGTHICNGASVTLGDAEGTFVGYATPAFLDALISAGMVAP